jgi:hypothetical protein
MSAQHSPGPKRFQVEVVQTLDVTVDESKFTETFMADFRKSFYDFHTIDDHVKHLAQMYARGIVTPFTRFIEGYGTPEDIGLDIREVDQEEDIVLRTAIAKATGSAS